jgi:hypothetical protein
MRRGLAIAWLIINISAASILTVDKIPVQNSIARTGLICLLIAVGVVSMFLVTDKEAKS